MDGCCYRGCIVWFPFTKCGSHVWALWPALSDRPDSKPHVSPVFVCHLLYVVVKMMINCLGEENTGSKFHPFSQIASVPLAPRQCISSLSPICLSERLIMYVVNKKEHFVLIQQRRSVTVRFWKQRWKDVHEQPTHVLVDGFSGLRFKVRRNLQMLTSAQGSDEHF